jgi:hypothetical protein
VTAAVGTYNLCSCHTESAILVTDNGTRDAVKVGWPAATRAELVARLIKRSVTTSTGINTLLRIVLVKLSRTRRFGTLLTQDTELLCER